MDSCARRGRRRRGRSQRNPFITAHTFTPPQNNKSWCLLNAMYSFFIMASLVGVIYLMLDYHCSTCSARHDLNNITKSINDIASNLSQMRDNYYELETKVSKFSQELPKLEGQIEILEALAIAIENDNYTFGPKLNSTKTNVDAFCKQASDNMENVTKSCPKHCIRRVKVQV